MKNKAKTIILLFISTLNLASSVTVSPYSQLGSSTSGSQILYDNFTTYMTRGPPAVQFSISYSAPKSTTPKLVIGLLGYDQRDDFTNSYLKLSISANTLASFNVSVLTSGSNYMYFIQISYISIQNINSAFYSMSVDYASFSTINTGSGDRTQNKLSNFFLLSSGASLSGDLTRNRAYVFLTGFEIQVVSGDFTLGVKVALTNSISFTTQIKTSSDCRVQFVGTMFLFIDTSKFTNSNIVIIDDLFNVTDSDYNNIALNSFTVVQSSKIIGLVRWKIQGTKNSGAITKFKPNIAADISFVLSSTIKFMKFQYILITSQSCPPSYPYYTNSSLTQCTAQCIPVTQTTRPASKICANCPAFCALCVQSPSNCSSCQTGYSFGTDNICIATVNPPSPTDPNNPTNPSQNTPIVTNASGKLYLLGLLGLIPIIILVVYLCIRRRRSGIQSSQFTLQPAMDLT